jgi:hypothetical protein
MEPSPAPHESPAKDGDNVVEPGSLSRFRRLARGLFGVNQKEFREKLAEDEAERRARRASKS